MEVGIKVVAENTQERTVRNTTRCYFTMVAYDKGKSVGGAAADAGHRNSQKAFLRSRDTQADAAGSGARDGRSLSRGPCCSRRRKRIARQHTASRPQHLRE
jgi:acyl-CoA hydrolase